MAPQSDFLLSKWYLDCIENDGNVFIGYAARLSWRTFSLSYTSTLEYQGDSQSSTQTSLRKTSLPQIEDGVITWSSLPLKVSGAWKALCPSMERALYESSEGLVKWSCLQPRAAAELHIGDRTIKGMGYVERLDSTIKPWLLPLDTLRWGRYLSDSHSIVWIDWKGPARKSFLFYDGRQKEDCVITDVEVAFDKGHSRLGLSEHTVLRKGPLLSTSLSMIPGAENIFPLKILQAQECKWRSRGFFQGANARSEQGWAIHEIVSFI